jgi:hypothetical protein
MAQVHAHQNAIPHDLFTQEVPPSPTLTNPEMILPYQRHLASSPVPQPSSPTLHSSPPPFRPDSAVSLGSSPRSLEPAVELGVAMTVRMPARTVPPIDTSYYGYEHGAPLSDIGEEETPKSRKSRRTQSPSVADGDPPSPTPGPGLGPAARAMKRLSTVSTSSNGSEFGNWEDFDSSKMMNSRLAEDVAKVPDEEVDDLDSKRNSMLAPDAVDEMTRLNERAERILDHARKRLTHMEDNLSKARHSILMPSRSSPNMNELHQPAGGLYRSISLAGASQRKLRPLQLVNRNNTVTHARGGSDTTTGTFGLKRLSMIPEARSASAQEYGRRQDSPQGFHASPTVRNGGYSPASARSFNSPLRVLQEEGSSPSTTKTSPETQAPRGLGINTLASVSREDVSASVSSPSAALARSSSVASNHSTKQIREQMTNLEAKISDLKEKAHADSERRRIQQMLRTPSPFGNAQAPEQWYTSAPEYKEAGSPINTNAGTGWSPTQPKKSLDAQVTPTTPQTRTLLNVENSATKDLSYVSEAKTDKNTPSLHKSVKLPLDTPETANSIIQDSVYEDAPQDFEDDEPVAASEEEQIYLNEVLEESLQDLEPEVPDIPEHLLPTDPSAERHEDRLDAFDYENMFLHSALGNYTGRRPRSETPSESDHSSVTTARAGQPTPTADDDDDDNDDNEEEADVPEAAQTPVQRRSPKATRQMASPVALVAPSKPWMRNMRSNSVNSVSTDASFATAIEGDNHDEDEEAGLPSEILTWGNGLGFPQPPTSPNRETIPISKARPTFPLSNGKAGQHSRSQTQTRSPTTQNTARMQGSTRTITPLQSPISSVSTPKARQYQPRPPSSGTASSEVDHPANTLILMESLVKLVEPDFKVRTAGTGPAFSDVDKDLVLDLLRAVGGVCNEILKAEGRGEIRAVKVLRRRLDESRRLLEGRNDE